MSIEADKLTYRMRIMVSAVLLMLFSQCIFYLIGYYNSRDTSMEIQDMTDNKIITSIERNVRSSLKDINALADSLDSTDFTQYSREYLNLRDEEFVRTSIEQLDQQFDALHLSPNMVDRIVLIGNNVNQKNFVYSPSGRAMPDDKIPWLEDLEKSGMMESLNKGVGIPVFIPKGEFTPLVSPKPGKEDGGGITRVRYLADQLEGRLVLTNGIDNQVLVLVVLRPDFLKWFLPEETWRDDCLTLLDKENRIVWSNISEDVLGIRPIKGVIKDQLEGRWTNQNKGITYFHRYKLLSPYYFKLVYTSSNRQMTETTRLLLHKYILLSLAAVAVTVLLSFLISSYILSPLKLLSSLIKHRVNEFPLQKIPISFLKNRRLQAVPLRGKLFLLFIVSVIIPIFSAGVLYAFFLIHFSENLLKSSLHAVTRQMSLSVRNEIDSYESLLYQLAVNGQVQQVLLPNSERAQPQKNLESALLMAYPKLSEISYFVLFDLSGAARYSTVFSNNLELFSSTMDTLTQNRLMDIVWSTATQDVYNQPAVSLMKNVFDPGFPNTAIGTLYAVLKGTAFQSIDPDHQVDFTILDHQGKVIYQSNSQAEQSEAAVQLLEKRDSSEWIQKVGSQDQLIVSGNISGTDWRLFVFQPLEGIYAKSMEQFYRNLLVVVFISLAAFAMAWLLSALLVRQTKHLQAAMGKIGKGEFHLQLAARSDDEIGELIYSFNRMMDQINQLMGENIRSRIREQELITLKTQAELGMLQQQINPHFLYNTLESINMRSMQYGAEDVCTMVSSLARIFRYSIGSGPEVVLLATEMEHALNYVSIQEIRFRDKFRVEWRLSDQALQCRILKFVLQPVIENAINHGLSEYPSGGCLVIKAEVQEKKLLLEVTDNGIGMDSEQLAKLRARLISGSADSDLSEPAGSRRGRRGVGLWNVYHRLDLYYQGMATMQVESDPAWGTAVRLILPADQTEEQPFYLTEAKNLEGI